MIDRFHGLSAKHLHLTIFESGTVTLDLDDTHLVFEHTEDLEKFIEGVDAVLAELRAEVARRDYEAEKGT